jgi:hypothetical protein
MRKLWRAGHWKSRIRSTPPRMAAGFPQESRHVPLKKTWREKPRAPARTGRRAQRVGTRD